MNVRWLPYDVADGPANMAADEALLQTAATYHIASLRFYGWRPATASLGYFQKAADRLTERMVAELPWVRRPTGGATLVHDRELTYALALPPGASWQTGEGWMPRMHGVIAAALSSLGVKASIRLVERQASHGGLLCFQQHTPGDLVCQGAKITGSAQRKSRHCVLQHGGILLARSPHAPQLPGLLELTGMQLTAAAVADAIITELSQTTGWRLERQPWTEDERHEIERLGTQKYGAKSWNERR